MPCTPLKRHELDELAVTSYEQVRGYFESTNLAEIGVRIPVQAVGEQGFDFRTTERARRKTDAMQHNQLRRRSIRASIAITARHLPGRTYQPALEVNVEFGGHGAFRSGMISVTWVRGYLFPAR